MFVISVPAMDRKFRILVALLKFRIRVSNAPGSGIPLAKPLFVALMASNSCHIGMLELLFDPAEHTRLREWLYAKAMIPRRHFGYSTRLEQEQGILAE